MDRLTETVALLPPMVEAARAEFLDLTRNVAGLTNDLACAKAGAEFAIQDLNRGISNLAGDLARAQAAIQDLNGRIAGLTTDLKRAQADADEKEIVIKELTGIIVEKDHRIADLMTIKKTRTPWWRHVIPKGM